MSLYSIGIERIINQKIMGRFESSTLFNAPQEFIPVACRKIKSEFEADGFDYAVKTESFNKTVVLVTKGNLVKQAIGLKQGLEITFKPECGMVSVNARGTVIKDQAIATILSMLVAWPVVIAQIIGLVNQSKLDEMAIETVTSAMAEYNEEKPVFCTHCGKKVKSTDGICPICGERL